MDEEPDNQALLDRLLNLIGAGPYPPTTDALRDLVARFAMRVPFENVSKLYRLKRYGLRNVPDLKTYVEGVQHFGFGGTCYTNNYHLHLLLVHLGYDVMFCGSDMSQPDVHTVNIVRVDGREFLVDAGYAAPFVQPLPRDLDHDFEVALGRDRYVLHPQDAEGRSRLDLFRDNELKHGYTIKPVHRPLEYFAPVIADSYRDSATFMNSLLLTRLFPNRSLVVYNLSVIESEGTDCRIRQLAHRDELPPTVETHFSIPRDIVAEAIAGLGDLGDAWS